MTVQALEGWLETWLEKTIGSIVQVVKILLGKYLHFRNWLVARRLDLIENNIFLMGWKTKLGPVKLADNSAPRGTKRHFFNLKPGLIEVKACDFTTIEAMGKLPGRRWN